MEEVPPTQKTRRAKEGKNMRNVTLEELLEAGCHFGHQVTRQNPKARDYIFEARDNIHIIDLEKTKEGIEDAGKYIKNLAQSGGTLLLLATKKQAQSVLDEEIKKLTDLGTVGVFWVRKRWIGGTFTNLQEVSKNFVKLKDFEKRLKDETIRSQYTKREIGEWDKDRQKLEGFYGGIAGMTKVPDAIFIVDTHIEDLAVRESTRMNVKTVGITDTNSDPTKIDYPIPANDDAVGSIKLIVEYILDAWREGRKQYESQVEKSLTVEAEAVKKEKTVTPKKETPVKKKAVKEEKAVEKKETKKKKVTKKKE